MSELGDLMREAFLGEDVFPEDRNRAAIEATMRKVDRRMTMVRIMAGFAVTVLFAASVWAAVTYLSDAGELSTKELVLRAAVFLGGLVGVQFGKLWFIVMQNQSQLHRELKRIQMSLLELRERS